MKASVTARFALLVTLIATLVDANFADRHNTLRRRDPNGHDSVTPRTRKGSRRRKLNGTAQRSRAYEYCGKSGGKDGGAPGGHTRNLTGCTCGKGGGPCIQYVPALPSTLPSFSPSINQENIDDFPVAPTQAPASRPLPSPVPTQVPTSQTLPPVAPTQVPTSPILPPVAPTQAPASLTLPPVAPTQGPTSPTLSPVAPTQAPAVPTQAPTSLTLPTVVPTQVQASPTLPPVLPTLPPTDDDRDEVDEDEGTNHSLDIDIEYEPYVPAGSNDVTGSTRTEDGPTDTNIVIISVPLLIAEEAPSNDGN